MHGDCLVLPVGEHLPGIEDVCSHEIAGPDEDLGEAIEVQPAMVLHEPHALVDVAVVDEDHHAAVAVLCKQGHRLSICGFGL